QRPGTAAGVNAPAGGGVGAAAPVIVNQTARQPTMHRIANKLVNRSAVRSFDCSARQPDLSTLWNVSIFQRIEYQPSFSTALARFSTGRSVSNFHRIGSRPIGWPRS